MNGKRYLAKNIGLLTISQFGTKLLSFFLVPLYTYVLTTEEYGIYDLNSTTVSLLLPILTLNISDAVLRFPMDKNSDKKGILAIGIRYFLISSLLAIVGATINYFFGIIPILNTYPSLFILLFILSCMNAILINYCRGIDSIKHVAISGIICSIVMIALNLLFLLPMHLGLVGYFWANIIGIAAQCLYIIIATKCWKNISFPISRPKQLEKEMIIYSRPLMINNISWWISSASDRYVVTWLCGIAANGIYSVGYKIPSILNIFQTIFGQAWTLSAVKDFDPKDENNFFTSMYNTYNFSMTFVCSCLIALSRIMASFLYAKDFYEAWKYVPFLLIAIVFGALSGYIGGIFAAVKDSKVFAKSSMIGAVVNIVLNIVLVKVFGPIGAAISTTICYLLIWILRMLAVKKYITLHLKLYRDIAVYIILLLQTIALFFIYDKTLILLLQIIMVLSIPLLFKTEIVAVIRKMKRRMN